ncbi:hypothetical protein ACIBHX_02230 [Nonomuraea sp. NPDC050536]|uniref:hypothetical protein n=1 Tax=Nonomuraea sp. NPDC050536 TaxID=3364366 RepID=UPI0037CAB3F9
MSVWRPAREYPAELLEEAVERVVYSGQSVGSVARDLDIAEMMLRRRVDAHYGDRRQKEAVARVRAGETPAAVAKALHTSTMKVDAWLEDFYDRNPEAYHVDHPPEPDPPIEEDVAIELAPPQLSKVDRVLLGWLGSAADDDAACPGLSPHPLSVRPNAVRLRWLHSPPSRFRVMLYTCPDHPVSFELGSLGGRYQFRRTRFVVEDGMSVIECEYSAEIYSRAEADAVWWKLLIGLAR